MRPSLTEEEAETFRRDEVLRYTGTAGADRIDPWRPAAVSPGRMPPDYVVGAGGAFATLQAAIDRAIADHAAGDPRRRVVIGLAPGTHEGLAYVPATPLHRPPLAITICGLGRTRDDTSLVATIDAEMPGAEYARRFAAQFAGSGDSVQQIHRRIAARDTITTANASVLRVESDDFQLLNLSVQNTYNADRAQAGSQEMNASGQYTTGQHQAVAVLIAGADRVLLHQVRMRSFQDTLYLQSPAKNATARTALTDCDIEGDVDFIFGQATAWFGGCTIRSLGRRAPQSWATAPSTDIRTRYGFVFEDCDFTHDGSAAARRGMFSLGRQWFEGVRATPYGQSPVTGYACALGAVSSYTPPLGTISKATLESVGKCVVLRSRIGAHVNAAAPWEDWNGGTWRRDGTYVPAPWHPRFRPVQARAGDLVRYLSHWLPAQGLSYDDVDPNAVLLGAFGNTTVDSAAP